MVWKSYGIVGVGVYQYRLLESWYGDRPSLTWSVVLRVFAGGAGGKGVWGRSGEVYGPEQVDEKDPNYDEAQVRW